METLIQSKELKLIDVGSATGLACPRCGANNLHHSTVKTFDRKEDGDAVLLATIEGGMASVRIAEAKTSGNPSSRRNGMTVRFWCEQCSGSGSDDLIELTIAQHKGSTEVGWRYTPRAPLSNSN